MPQEKLNKGHRKRVRLKFLSSSSVDSFEEYEILEMLLFSVYPRQDTKAIAKELLKEYGSLKNLYLQDIDSLAVKSRIPESVRFQIKLSKELFSRITVEDKKRINRTCVIEDWSDVLQYLKLNMGYKKKEFFKALYLNRSNALIGKQLFDSGTIDKISVYPRELVKDAIKNDAAAVVIAHNHPSGSIEPSKKDIELTNIIKKALNAVEIALHDHVIIAKDKVFSFRENLIL